MNTDHIREFLVLAESESYVLAAEQLNISEPTLSRHISGLEAEIGVRLFDRSFRRVRINRFGRLYREYARQFLALEENWQRKLQDAIRGKAGSITVTTCYYINDLLTAFYAHSPGHRVISSVDISMDNARSCEELRN